MIELMLVALLLWLWVIERRLNALSQTMRSLKLDVDAARATRAAPERLGRVEPDPEAADVLAFERPPTRSGDAETGRHEPRVH